MIKKIFELLAPGEVRQVTLLLCMMVVMAFLDMVGVASIMPFMTILASPEMLETNYFLGYLFKISKGLGVENREDFLLAMGAGVFLLLLFSLAFKALTTYYLLRFSHMREYTISRRLVEGYLRQPYDWFLSRHSADLGKTILSEVGAVISYAVVPLMTLTAQAAVTLALVILLVLVDPMLAFIMGCTLSVCYGVIFRLSKNHLSAIGDERIEANKGRFTVAGEAFGAIKEVKFAGLEKAYESRFARWAHIYARHQSSAQIISQLPRFGLEAIAFGGMLAIVLYSLRASGSFGAGIPIIAVYAFAGYRLMPALQQIYGVLTQLRFAAPAVDVLHSEIVALRNTSEEQVDAEIRFDRHIMLRNVSYSYPGSSRWALKRLNLLIQARSTIGLVGVSGSGKTTIVDLILGLLEPTKGSLVVDGIVIDAKNRRSWQSKIGYVPQQIFLADDTIAANIAFGVEKSKVDKRALERAAKIACLHSFVANELPMQYETVVGERGVRLSGGQRQRIGIARAVYHNPEILILDEATSALDSLTEEVVMEAVHNLQNSMTILLIAHRLSTVRLCDNIILIEGGELVGEGTFDHLCSSNEHFRAMTSADR